jgi:PIN domain nuclease of toxin-antitoxin system
VATLTHLDSHVVVWLVTGEHARLSRTAKAMIEENRLEVSPMVGLELAYLREIGRLDLEATEVLSELRRSIDLRESDEPFGSVASIARGLFWTRDPFDRLIVAQAMAAGARLLTRDDTILEHFSHATW